MVNDEKRFAEILEDIKFSARSKGGYIEENEIKEAFTELQLSEDQLKMVYDYLEANKIGIGKKLEITEDDLPEEDRDILKAYEEELKELTPLSDGEKRAATMAAMNGEEEGKSKLLTEYLPRVIEIAKLYSGQGVFLEDLIGEGNLALLEGINMLGALEEVDEAEGMLIKLVMNGMEELITETLNDSKTDEKVLNKVNEVSKKASELRMELGRKVTVSELSEESGLSENKILEAIRLSGNKIEDIEYT